MTGRGRGTTPGEIPLRLSRTCKTNIDYKELHSKGHYVEKQTEQCVEAEGSAELSQIATQLNIEEAVNVLDLSLVDLDRVSIGSLKATKVSSPPPTGSVFSSQLVSQACKKLISTVVSPAQSEMPDTNSEEVTDVKPRTESCEMDLDILEDDIGDYIEEHALDGVTLTISDIDAQTEKLVSLRTQYRCLARKIKSVVSSDIYQRQYENRTQNTLTEIKGYIQNANQQREKKRKSEEYERTDEQKTRIESSKAVLSQAAVTAKFVVDEVLRIASELYDEFHKNKAMIGDEELLRRKEAIPDYSIKTDKLFTKIQKAFEIIPPQEEHRNDIIDKIKSMYQKVIDEKKLYENHVQQELAERELMKEFFFKTSSLNIKLAKFTGFSAELDIFTFQSEFEKLYKRSTPKHLLPDLLKNNFLDDAALALVKTVETIEEIWRRLKIAYGDPKVMIQRRLAEVERIGMLTKLKKPEDLKEAFMKIINTMNDLVKIAEKHRVDNVLYYGGAINTVYSIMGDDRLTRWLRYVKVDSSDCDSLDEKDSWIKLVCFLEKELRLQQEMSKIRRGFEEGFNLRSSALLASELSDQSDRCHFCGESGHIKTDGPGGGKLIQYFSCKKFAEMKPNQRFLELRSKGLCFQCLFPGAHHDTGKHKDGSCQIEFACKHHSHRNFPSTKHVLICQEHCSTDENKKLLEEYRSRCIVRPGNNLEEFSRNIKLCFHSFASHDRAIHKETESKETAIFTLQTIKIGAETYTLFFDSGCSDFVSRYSATMRIGDRSTHEIEGPISLGGVGSVRTVSKHGMYKVRLPLNDGSDAVFAGVCLDKVTSTFPKYPIQGRVQKDIEEAYAAHGGHSSHLPGLPDVIGGDVDFLIGIRYLRYHPEPIFSLPSGLTIYKSPFLNANGTRGVVGGPHALFTEISKGFYHSSSSPQLYLSEQLQLFNQGFLLSPDEYYLDQNFIRNVRGDANYCHNLTEGDIAKSAQSDGKYLSLVTERNQKLFEEVEDAGSEIFYRCMDCRKCQKCLQGDKIELISVKEEIEQDIINESIKVNLSKGEVTARLPLIYDAKERLAPNKKKALAVFKSQISRITTEEREEIIKSEKKMHDLGYVEYVKDLSSEQQRKLHESAIQNFIPWRVVYNTNSCSTPTRLVFDASQPTSSSYSLNDILAKGRNSMNKLLEIVIRWNVHKIGFHTDVQKMFNSVKLEEDQWCFQRYIWEKDLDKCKIPEEKIIKTLIYGVKPSGNQAERAMRETASMLKEEYPNANEIVQQDIYVDDCLSGSSSTKEAYRLSDELTVVLKKGGFNLKGVTFSGRKPVLELTQDGESVNVAGCKWFPEEDKISLDISELNFSKKHRGKKNPKSNNIIPEHLTRRDCTGKVAELFDITGRVTPIVASMKLCLAELVNQKFSWDDKLPDDLKNIWLSHFKMIKELKSVKFNRAVVPVDAVNMDINTIELGDASNKIACSAIYVRFKRRCGLYSCQLIFARSKILKEMSQPRAELRAAMLNVHTGVVVRRSLQKYFRSGLKLTDSQIVLHWINNDELPLKKWVRNRINEILRFTQVEEWAYVDSANMLADLGTRKGATISDVGPDSYWCNGYEWMKKENTEFPIKSVDQIKLRESEVESCKRELLLERESALPDAHICYPIGINVDQNRVVPEQLASYYQYSQYLIDPNKFRFKIVVRIMAYVMRFVKNLIQKHRQKKGYNLSLQTDKTLNEKEIRDAENYFYQKATQELKKFVDSKEYKTISVEKMDILYHTGRILPTQKVTANTELTDVMKDLCATTFVIPMVSEYSPVAYSIINEVHWHHPVGKHCGVETVLRLTMDFAFILNGRELVKLFRRNCEHCRYLQKKALEVAMGPVSHQNMKIAPAFYYTQVDIAGPFTAHSLFNKRKSIKVYFVVFCCSTTSTINIKVMEDYGSPAFIKAFIRFSCEVGYPKQLLPDEGSQLIKSCEVMKLNFKDLQGQLHLKYGVEFKPCPVGGHNAHGRVERKIRQIKESLQKVEGVKCSVMEWETLGYQIANSINDLPLGFKGVSSAMDSVDLITPNRLKLGRNNQRSPVGTLDVSANIDRFLTTNKDIYNLWFTNWLICHVPKLVHQQKWFHNDRELIVGDIILFLKNEGKVIGSYQYGMVKAVNRSTDGLVRSVVIKYRNASENVDRETNRAIRQLVLIHPIEELGILQEVGEMATKADVHLSVYTTSYCDSAY